MENKIIDKFDSPLAIGDDVIFAKGGKSDTALYTGKLESINGNFIDILDHKTRKINNRYYGDCILLKPYKDANPEYFI